MKRLWPLGAWAFIALQAFAVHPVWAQSLPSKEEATHVLETVRHPMSFTEAGIPFHFAAKLHYTLDATSLDGTYEVLWASPGRFREEFRLGSIGESVVALEDKLYLLRSTPVPAYPAERVRILTHLPSPVTFTASRPPQFSKVYRSNNTAANELCFDFGSPPTITDCVDSATGHFVSIREDGKLISSIQDRFVSVLGLTYPGHIFFRAGHESFEITVDKLETVAHFADDLFVPPTGATSHEWCANPDGFNPQDRSPLGKLTGGMTASPLPKGFRGFYVQVGPNGRVEQAAEMYADGTAKRSVDKDLNRARFSIRSCGGKPIEYEIHETIISLPVR